MSLEPDEGGLRRPFPSGRPLRLGGLVEVLALGGQDLGLSVVRLGEGGLGGRQESSVIVVRGAEGQIRFRYI